MDNRDLNHHRSVESAVGRLNTGKVAAVVVTYHPDNGFPERLTRLAQQVCKVIVVDNGSDRDALLMLRESASSLNVDLIENERNLGVASALNQGARIVLSQGYSWILTLDQDSKPEPEMVDRLVSAYVNHPKNEAVAVVASIPVDEQSGRAELAELCDGEESSEVTTILTSGSLLVGPILVSTGMFREDFFIDYVDAEYCLRARKAGYSIILACKARLLHNLGTPTYHRFLWKSRVVTTNHSPMRRYYITRNRVLLMKEYALQEPSWTVGELQAFLKEVAKMLLFETSRKRKVKFFLRGVVDALLNRTGEFRKSAYGETRANLP